MSSSIAIPGAALPALQFELRESGKAAVSSTSSFSSTPSTPEPIKAATPTSEDKILHQRRPSLLSTCHAAVLAGPVAAVTWLQASRIGHSPD